MSQPHPVNWPDGLNQLGRARAKRQGISFSELIRTALKEKLEREAKTGFKLSTIIKNSTGKKIGVFHHD